MSQPQRHLPLTILSFFILLLASLPATAQDGDYDGLPDSLELALAQQFFPTLNLHCQTYEGLPAGDRRQLYGLTVPGYVNSSNGRIPFVAHPYSPNNGLDCAEPFQCIEIRYGIAWNWDLGDDQANWTTFGPPHQGDSEMYAILVARKDTDGGSDWGVGWDVAQNNASQWRLIKEFMSAHWMDSGESSSYRSHGNFGTFNYQKVWAAEGKHAMYPTQNACNNGGYADADDCGDNRCDIVSEVFLKVQNAGEQNAWLNPYIPFPAPSKHEAPYGTYNVWSGIPFGASKTTPYLKVFTTGLAWCPAFPPTCMTDCGYQNECPEGSYYAGSCPQDCGYGPEPGGLLCQSYDGICY